MAEPSLATQQELVQSWLRDALRRGDCGGLWEGRFPRYIWRKSGEQAYEARLTNRGTGEYKGYPMALDECPL